MTIALGARQCVPRGTSQKLHCAQPSAGLDQIGDTARIRTRYEVFFIVLCNQGSACHIECLSPGFRPVFGISDCNCEHFQALWIDQQSMESLSLGRRDKILRMFDSENCVQKPVDILIGQGIESEHLDGSAGRYLLEMIPVVCSKPIGHPTRQAKARTPHTVEFGTDTVQWRAPVGRSCPVSRPAHR